MSIAAPAAGRLRWPPPRGPCQLGALAGQHRQQESPPAAGHVHFLAADPVQDRRRRTAHIELGADLLERLLRDAFDLDHDRAVVDLEAVDVAVSRPPAPAPITMASKSRTLPTLLDGAV